MLRGKDRQVASAGVVRMRVRNIAQLHPRLRDHLVGNVDAMDFAEMPAHRTHQTPRPAADLERPPLGRGFLRRQSLQFAFQIAHHIFGSRKKLTVILIPSSERDVIIRVLAGALVPVGAHALVNVHAVILAVRLSAASDSPPLIDPNVVDIQRTITPAKLHSEEHRLPRHAVDRFEALLSIDEPCDLVPIPLDRDDMERRRQVGRGK